MLYICYMFSKEEAKKLREEFWDSFKQMSSGRRARKKLPGNWLLSQTGIKALNLRFHVDRNVAQVGIDLETRNMDKRFELFEKLESLKKILEEAMESPLIWELDYTRENGKSVSRIYLQMEGVDIYDRDTWTAAHKFMYENMMKLESFYREYGDYFKYGPN
jgi:vacuolar-type H+-ATPase catalytic subunit A/Vma1